MSLLPLTYKTVDEINTDLPIYLKRNIGQGVFISDKQELDSKTQLWVIGNSYPAFFHIPVDSPPVVRFVTFKNISTIKIEKNENTKSFHVFVPSRKSLIEKHKEKYSSMLTSVENSLLDITKLNYVKIPLVHTAMSRIISILEDLERDTQVNPKNCPNKERDKLMKYLRFLVDLDYVRQEGELFVEGNRLNIIKYELSKNIDDSEEILQRILADVIKIGYPYMKKHLRLLQIVPYLRIVTSYYYPSFTFKKLISINRNEMAQFIARYLYSFYNIKKPALDGENDSRLNSQISDVVHSKIFTMKDNVITGNSTIFKNFKNSLVLDY